MCREIEGLEEMERKGILAVTQQDQPTESDLQPVSKCKKVFQAENTIEELKDAFMFYEELVTQKYDEHVCGIVNHEIVAENLVSKIITVWQKHQNNREIVFSAVHLLGSLATVEIPASYCYNSHIIQSVIPVHFFKINA